MARTGEQQDAAERERRRHHTLGRVAEPQDALGEHGVGRVAGAGHHGQHDPQRVDGCVGAAAEHEQQHASAGQRGRGGPAAGERLAVEEARGDAGDRGRRAERDDRADGDARAVDGGEEGELVDGDGRGDHAQLPPRPGGGRGGDGAGDEEEERPADHDARGADAGGGGVGAERLGGARGAEADGGEEDEHLGHVLDCSTIFQDCQEVTSHAAGWGAGSYLQVNVDGRRRPAPASTFVARGRSNVDSRRPARRSSTFIRLPHPAAVDVQDPAAQGSRSALTSAGSPRSGNGMSIASKSRGTTAAGNIARASSRTSRGK